MVESNFCCEKKYPPKLLGCTQASKTTCCLDVIDYDVNIFSQELVPIYGCKNVSSVFNSKFEIYEDRTDAHDVDFDLHYSKLNFPNEIWNIRESWEIAIKTAAVIPLVLVAILGNLMVIKIILTTKAMRKNPVNLFIFNMSIADLLCALLFPWIFLISDFYQKFVLGPFICKCEGFVLVTLMLASVFTLTVISFDRLIAIVLPFNLRMKPKSAKWIIIAIWVIACGISSPLIIYRTYKERQWKDYHEAWCTEDIKKLKDYWLVLVVLLVWVPLIILTVCYTAIIVKLDTLEKRQHNQPISQIKHKSKVIRMLFLVILVFSTCWIPFTVTIFIRNNFNNRTAIEVTEWYRTLFFISHYLMLLNSALNPIIYGFMNDNFKRELRNQGLPSCLKRQKKVEVSTVLQNGRIGGVPATTKRLERTRFQKVAAKYGLVLSTTSSSIPSLSYFDRRNSALVDLGLPIPVQKDVSSSESFARLNYELFKH